MWLGGRLRDRGGRALCGTDYRDGWRWEPYAVDGTDVEPARQQLQRLMRDAEADIAEALSNDGLLTVLEDAPPPHVRPRALGQSAGADGRGTVGPLRDEGRSLPLLPARG